MGVKTVSNPDANKVNEGTLLDTTKEVTLMSTNAFSTKDEFVDKQTAGISSIAHFVAGGFIGEGFGHRRAASGKDAILPFMRVNA